MKTRIITGCIAGISALAAIHFGGYIFSILIALLIFIAWHEYAQIIKRLNYNPLVKYSYPLMAIIALLAVIAPLKVTPFIIVLVTFFYFVLFLFAKNIKLRDISGLILGMYYILMGFFSLLIIRDNAFAINIAMPDKYISGEVLVYFILISIWASDTCAYFTGKYFGKNKIVPTISPNKTLEGFIGGAIGTIIVGLLFGILSEAKFIHALMIAIIIAISAPLGDLFESKLKRMAKIKDSGNILPGHGGILDRFDSLLLALPLVMTYILCNS